MRVLIGNAIKNTFLIQCDQIHKYLGLFFKIALQSRQIFVDLSDATHDGIP